MAVLRVTYKIDARYDVEVEANTVEEAISKAKERYYDADFGEARDVDGDVIIVANDETDEYLYEK